MIGEMKTGLSVLNAIRKAINHWRNIPLIEEQARIITNLESQVTALQQTNALIHQTTLKQKETIVTQQGRIRELDDMNTQLENWKIEAERYELVELPPATYVYRLKEGAQNGEPSHYICAHCYNRSVKSILQSHPQARLGQNILICPACKTVFKAGKQQPEHRPKIVGSWVTKHPWEW